ncbi:MAG: DUF6728 family protein [Arcticibacter sp.]
MYFFRKDNPERPKSFNLKVMHFINALAVLLFVLGILYKIIDWYFL